MKLRELGEDRLLARLLRSLPTSDDVIVGPGGDCAIVEPARGNELLVLKTDCVVEEIHFTDSVGPALVGWKAMVRPLSDFAAVSGVPKFALISLIVPANKSTAWVATLYRGLRRAAGRFHVTIVGGETSNTRGPVVISVAVAGFVEKNRFVTRHGGKAGDALFVTGRLGGALRGKHLRFVPRIEESRWLTKHFRIHAMMDLSDGLGADLPRLARASGVGFQIDKNALPLAAGANIKAAISDGEDYELLFAISQRDQRRLESSWRRKFPKLRLTRIGAFVPQSAKGQSGRRLAVESSDRTSSLKRGYVHFQ